LLLEYRMRRSALSLAALSALTLVAAGSASAAAFNTDDLVIYRVGTGSGALSNASTQVFLDEYTTAGSLVQSITVPSKALIPLTASGSATSEGLITRSADGRYLDFTGYGATTGVTGIASTPTTGTSAYKREVAQADANGNIATVAVLDAYSGNNIRSAVSVDGSSFYSSGNATSNAGVRYGLGGTTSVAVSTQLNTRQVNIYGGQLYYSTGSGSTGVYALGTGTPTSSATPTLIAASSSPYAFLFADLSSSVAGYDTLYVANDSKGIEKYSFASGVWSLTGTLAASGVTGLTGAVGSDGQVKLYATNANKLYGVLDSAGYNQAINGTLTTLATAATNTAFRGVALSPVPEPETVALLLAGLAVLGGVARQQRRR